MLARMITFFVSTFKLTVYTKKEIYYLQRAPLELRTCVVPSLIFCSFLLRNWTEVVGSGVALFRAVLLSF